MTTFVESQGLEIHKEEDETEIHTRRANRAEQFKIFSLITAVIIYGVYGIIKVDENISNPDIKYQDSTTSAYDVPVIVGCVDTESYFTFYVSSTKNGNNTVIEYGDYTPSPSFNYDNAKRLNWQIFYGSTCFYYYCTTCFVIIPPSETTIVHPFVVYFAIRQDGMFDTNHTFGGSASSVPTFLADQYHYSIEHKAFHIDELYQTFSYAGKESGANIPSDELVQYAYSTSSSLYATACSINDVQLELQTTYKFYDIKEENSYVMTPYGSLIDMTETYFAEIDGCFVAVEYYAKTFQSSLYQQQGTRYSAYGVQDLFSGIGGIISVTQTVFGVIIPIILVGVTIKQLNLHWRGYAPFPKFDDNFQEKLRRFIKYLK